MAGLLEVFIALTVADQASDKIKKISSTTSSEFGKIGGNIGKGLKIVGAGIASAVTAIGTFTTVATKAYANYEQLVGGVSTLFGTNEQSFSEWAKTTSLSSQEAQAKYADLMAAQKQVLADADAAYKTAGLSANQYMENVTGFAAALTTSLNGDTQKAAQYANMAMTDMADNYNKMGSTMESVQNAYQGFAKQNFTMLDNLKLGYGGTKQEMERLLSDAEKIAGKKFDVSSYADIVEAIHTVQTEMGITGTTAREAEHTISGSVNSMKAAWQNWLTGLGNSSADMTALSSQLIQSFETVVGNILPVAGNILTALTDTLKTDGPTLFGEAFSFISENIPSLVDTGLALLGGIADGITENLPTLLSCGIDIALQIAEGIVSGIPDLIAKVPEIITGLKDAITEKLPEIKEAGGKIIDHLQEALNNAGIDINLDNIISAFDKVKSTVSNVADFISSGMSTAWKKIQSVWANVSPYFSAIWDGIKSAFSAVAGVLGGFFSAAWDGIKGVWNSVTPYFSTIWESIKNIFSVVSGWLGDIFSSAWSAIQSAWEVAAPFFSTVWDGIKGVFSTVSSWLPGVWSVAWSTIQAVWTAATGFFASIWATISGVFSAVEAVLSGDFEGAWTAIKGIVDQWAEYFGDIWSKIKDVFSDAVKVGSKIVDDIKSGISSAWDTLTDWFEGIWDTLFGNRKVNVSVTGTTSSAGKAIGMEYIPYNGFPATLHRGEAVLNTVEADRWRRGLDRTGNIISDAQAPRINIYDSGNRDILNMILDSIGTNLNRDIRNDIRNGNRGITKRDFARAVRSVE